MDKEIGSTEDGIAALAAGEPVTFLGPWGLREADGELVANLIAVRSGDGERAANAAKRLVAKHYTWYQVYSHPQARRALWPHFSPRVGHELERRSDEGARPSDKRPVGQAWEDLAAPALCSAVLHPDVARMKVLEAATWLKRQIRYGVERELFDGLTWKQWAKRNVREIQIGTWDWDDNEMDEQLRAEYPTGLLDRTLGELELAIAIEQELEPIDREIVLGAPGQDGGLARKLGISLDALWQRRHRIRARLQHGLNR